nr:MAG TPA: hypothetical protein [Caudoviricetes sp.]
MYVQLVPTILTNLITNFETLFVQVLYIRINMLQIYHHV